MFKTKPIRILSIDGGGIRGILPAMILAKLEELTGQPVANLFDLIAGTSTGGVLALGLVKPNAEGKPAYTANSLVEFYENQGPKIFQADLLYKSKTIASLVGPKYPSEPLELVLKEHFAETTLDEALVPVIITAYEIERRMSWFFKSRHAKQQETRNFLMREVARATSAAPTFFAPVKIKANNGSDYYSFIDGGVFANNPGMCALVEAKKMFPENRNMVMVSLGTGFLTSRINYHQAKTWGLASWAEAMLNVVFDGVSDSVDYQLSKLIVPTNNQKNYYRFQTELDKKTGDLDNASVQNIRHLRLIAEDVIRASKTDLDTLAKILIRK